VLKHLKRFSFILLFGFGIFGYYFFNEVMMMQLYSEHRIKETPFNRIMFTLGFGCLLMATFGLILAWKQAEQRLM
jgi:hypothetical protein